MYAAPDVAEKWIHSKGKKVQAIEDRLKYFEIIL